MAGELDECDFDGDGSYRIVSSMIGTGLPPDTLASCSFDVDVELAKVIFKMNTLVCMSCCSKEIREHPHLGDSPMVRGKAKNEWSKAMADFAIQSGWTCIRHEEGITIGVCPKCAKKLKK